MGTAPAMIATTMHSRGRRYCRCFSCSRCFILTCRRWERTVAAPVIAPQRSLRLRSKAGIGGSYMQPDGRVQLGGNCVVSGKSAAS